MKLLRPAFFLSLVAVGFLPCSTLRAESKPTADPGEVAIKVSRLLESGHYMRGMQEMRDKDGKSMSQRVLENYLKLLDYNKLYFTQADVSEFAGKYSDNLYNAAARGNLEPARDIFRRFKQRVEDRIEANKKLANQKYTFDSDRLVEINRQKADWPKDDAEADRLWRARVEAELLQEKLNEIHLRPPEKVLTKRYDQVLRSVREMEDGDVVKTFLSALAQTYDPHSDYLSQSDLENFSISMKLSLVGVGAVLSSEDGYAKVKEVVVGGPADRDGRLKVGDRIAAVAQGDGELEDVVDMKLDKVVEKIRGKKNTIVRLLVLPSDATDPSKRQVIDIRRDEVSLKEQAAKAEVIDIKGQDGRPVRLGWITLPSFYSDMDKSGAEKVRSTTKDVAALLKRLKQEGIQGLVMDLRRDGGGSLEEAIDLTGLFIDSGPVVQAKDSNGKIAVSRDKNPTATYDGPMIVLTNRLSASASEIFAGALQDYGRAVIVGDEQTFGKGTVQTMFEVGRIMPMFSLLGGDSAPGAGAVKFTLQKFYRVSGESTQLEGVKSDIVLPSLTDNPEIGEKSFTNPLEHDSVAPLNYQNFSTAPLPVAALGERALERVKTDPEFRYIMEDRERITKRIEENRLSLNEAQRRQELADEKLRKETREKDRDKRGPAFQAQAFQLNLEDVGKEKLELVAYNRKPDKAAMLDDESEAPAPKKTEKPLPDPVRDESLRILIDLISLTHHEATAKVSSS